MYLTGGSAPQQGRGSGVGVCGFNCGCGFVAQPTIYAAQLPSICTASYIMYTEVVLSNAYARVKNIGYT